MKEILLTPSKYGQMVALVDDEDYDWLSQYTWYAGKRKNLWYVYRGNEENGRKVAMHRMILGTPQGMETDHKNGNGFDNRRENIRICTHSENNCNQRPQIRQKSSMFKGVHWCVTYKKWIARIKLNQQWIYLGGFHNEVEAALAYDAGALKYHGEFARLNFIAI